MYIKFNTWNKSLNSRLQEIIFRHTSTDIEHDINPITSNPELDSDLVI